MNRPARIRPYLFAALAAAIATACSSGEQGVISAQEDDAVVVLSEGACLGPCPVYDMTLHPNGAYVLNGERFVKDQGVSEGNIGSAAFDSAENILSEAGFWTLKAKQTLETLPDCHTDAPTAKITWRTKAGKEKTVEYNAGCGVEKMQQLVGQLRVALRFNNLVWTDEKFGPDGTR